MLLTICVNYYLFQSKYSSNMDLRNFDDEPDNMCMNCGRKKVIYEYIKIPSRGFDQHPRILILSRFGFNPKHFGTNFRILDFKLISGRNWRSMTFLFCSRECLDNYKDTEDLQDAVTINENTPDEVRNMYSYLQIGDHAPNAIINAEIRQGTIW